jgi:hypothetical protein
MGRFGLCSIGIGACIIIDAIGETIMLAVGTYAYPGSIKSLSWVGGKGRMPVYEAILWGLCWGAVACVRYCKDDKGDNIAERGVESLRATPRQKQGLRLLAKIAVVNLSFLLLYNLPWQWMATHAGNWPKEVRDATYLNGQFCGKDTDYMCAGPRVPMPVGGDSGHVRPDGTFVAPKGLPIDSE